MKNSFIGLNLLYVGPLTPGGTCLQRMHALQQLEISVSQVDTAARLPQLKLPYPLNAALSRAFTWSTRPSIQSRILKTAALHQPQIVWIDKGINVLPSTLRKLREQQANIRLLSYSPDDMFNPQVTTRAYRDSIPLFDLHVTTKSFNVTELYAAGARDVLFIDNAFDPELHRPVPTNEQLRSQYGGDVGFIGSYESDREEKLRFLASRGIAVRIWGDWPKRRSYPAGMLVEGRELIGEAYAQAINSFAINICFLRKASRDLQTTRSIEIPACGGFMLAERTCEHERLFEEAREAAFFSSKEELEAKTRYYLGNPEERSRIAAAGRLRCIEGSYSNVSRLSQVLDYLLSRYPISP
ncbi:MAG: glycosyltransferase [Deltaproteobacteria bacterium]|nr:glycosyltransferase [Deltaproteobacteria bacterium]